MTCVIWLVLCFVVWCKLDCKQAPRQIAAYCAVCVLACIICLWHECAKIIVSTLSPISKFTVIFVIIISVNSPKPISEHLHSVYNFLQELYQGLPNEIEQRYFKTKFMYSTNCIYWWIVHVSNSSQVSKVVLLYMALTILACVTWSLHNWPIICRDLIRYFIS